MKNINLFDSIIKGIEGLGFYNPEMKVYALKSEGNASKIIFDYLCRNILLEEHEKFVAINQQTEPIIGGEEIRILKERGYTKL